jgi:hypothetical protein
VKAWVHRLLKHNELPVKMDAMVDTELVSVQERGQLLLLLLLWFISCDLLRSTSEKMHFANLNVSTWK